MILKLIKFFEDMKVILILQIKNFPDMYLAKYDYAKAKYLFTDESYKKCSCSNNYAKSKYLEKINLNNYYPEEIRPHY